MAIGESQRDDVVIERRRTAVIALAATGIVLAVLAAGGVLDWDAAILSAGALTALMALYLAAAGQSDEPRRAVAHASGETGASVPVDDSAQAVLDALPDPVVVVRAGGRVETINAAARRELRSVRGVDGALASLVREPRVLDAVEAVLAGGDQRDVEYKEPAPRERHLRALVVPFRRAPGEVLRAVVVIRDESVIKRAEAARADFLANASHELRTPLASLTGFIETLSGHARHDEAARDRFLGIMSTQADRMRRLLDDLLSLSRLEQSEHVAPGDQVELVRLAGGVADSLEPVAADRRVSIRIDAQVTSAWVAGARDELVQVVQNLLDNAIKYSPPGGEVTVEIGAADSAAQAAHAPDLLAPHAARMTLLETTDDPAAAYAWVRITDHGPGIARAHLPRLSERFFRCESDAPSGVGGTGLGLAIVRQAMARHRGGVTVESAPGAGSRFTAYVRLIGPAPPP